MEKRPRSPTLNELPTSPSLKVQKRNPTEENRSVPATTGGTDVEIGTLNSTNIDLINTFLSPSSKNNDSFPISRNSSESTVSRSTSRSSDELVTSELATMTTMTTNNKTIASTAINVTPQHSNRAIGKANIKTKKSSSPRPPSLKINIASSNTFERPSAILPAIKTPVSVKSERATQLHRAVLSRNITDVDTILKTTGFSLINKQDDNGYTALMSAAALADSKVGLAICKLLLNENADVDLFDHEGFTAFHWASAVGNDAICIYLATETAIDVNARSKYKY
eukprot:g2677.t1